MLGEVPAHEPNAYILGYKGKSSLAKFVAKLSLSIASHLDYHFKGKAK